MCTASVHPESNRLFGTSAVVPDVKISAAVSPTIRPIAKITPDKIPGTADGNTT